MHLVKGIVALSRPQIPPVFFGGLHLDASLFLFYRGACSEAGFCLVMEMGSNSVCTYRMSSSVRD